MPENVTLVSPSIGASNSELSRYILDNEEIIDEIMERLQGIVAVRDADGTRRVIKIKDRAYSDKCLAWFKGKMREILNKNMALSFLDEPSMYREAQYIIVSFHEELWLSWRTYLSENESIAVDQYKELTSMYCNYLSESIRHPLQKGIRDLISHTTTESRQNIVQTVSEQQERKGFLGGLLGGR